MPLRAERLRDAREKKGLTQRELGKICGINFYQISRYETGKSDISGDSLEMIARHLDVSTDYLLGLSVHPQGQLGDSELTEEEHIVLNTLRNEGWSGIARLGVERLSK